MAVNQKFFEDSSNKSELTQFKETNALSSSSQALCEEAVSEVINDNQSEIIPQTREVCLRDSGATRKISLSSFKNIDDWKVKLPSLLMSHCLQVVMKESKSISWRNSNFSKVYISSTDFKLVICKRNTVDGYGSGPKKILPTVIDAESITFTYKANDKLNKYVLNTNNTELSRRRHCPASRQLPIRYQQLIPVTRQAQDENDLNTIKELSQQFSAELEIQRSLRYRSCISSLTNLIKSNKLAPDVALRLAAHLETLKAKANDMA